MMWDWSGTKAAPPPVKSRDEDVLDARNQGVTPVRRDVRPMPIYRDPRQFKTLPPTAPSYGEPQPYAPAGGYPSRQPQPYAPQQPQPYAPQPYAPQQPQPYAPQPYAPQPYAPQQPQPYAPQPYAPQPYAPQPYAPQPYAPQPYAPQPYAPQPYAPVPVQQQQQQPYAPQPQPMPSGNPENDKSLWEWQFSQLNLPNMELIEVNYVRLDPAWLSELRKAFKRTRRDFLKYVGYHHTNELVSAGMGEDDIRQVKKGNAPENFNIHIKIPFDYGGTNSFSNLVLVQTHPYHTEIHRFIDMQTLTAPSLKPMKLYLPNPPGKVYIPGEIEISTGGTSRHDRSVYAGFLESTFEMIEQRSMMGR